MGERIVPPSRTKERLSADGKRYYLIHRDEIIAYHIKYQENLKKLVLTHYGGGNPICIICGMDDIDCLNIDHIDDGGAELRRNGHRSEHSGSRLYNRLVHTNYPEGFQTLCANCNLKKEIVRKRNKRNTR